MLHTNFWHGPQLEQATAPRRRTRRKRLWTEMDILPIDLPTMQTNLEDIGKLMPRPDDLWSFDMSAAGLIDFEADELHIQSRGTTYKYTYRHHWFDKIVELEPEEIVVLVDGLDERNPDADLDWLGSHVQQLGLQYSGQWVAIVDGEVRAAAHSLPDLMQLIESEGMATPLVTFVPEQEVTWRMAYDIQGV